MASSQHKAGPCICLPSRAMPHNKKFGFSSNFSASNLVVVVVLLAIAMILIVVKATQQETTLRGWAEVIYHYQAIELIVTNTRTPDLTWYG